MGWKSTILGDNLSFDLKKKNLSYPQDCSKLWETIKGQFSPKESPCALSAPKMYYISRCRVWWNFIVLKLYRITREPPPPVPMLPLVNFWTSSSQTLIHCRHKALSPYWHIVTKFEIKGFYKRNWIFNIVLKYSVSDLFTVGFWTVRGTFCIQLSIFLFNINTF